MTDINDTAAVRDRLWKEISRHGLTVMLGAHTHPMRHFQPMTAFCEPEQGLIWFFTRTDTDLARSIEEGKGAMLIVQDGQKFHACVGGELTLQHDTAHRQVLEPRRFGLVPGRQGRPAPDDALPRGRRRPGLDQRGRSAEVRLRDRQGERHRPDARRGRQPAD